MRTLLRLGLLTGAGIHAYAMAISPLPPTVTYPAVLLVCGAVGIMVVYDVADHHQPRPPRRLARAARRVWQTVAR